MVLTCPLFGAIEQAFSQPGEDATLESTSMKIALHLERVVEIPVRDETRHVAVYGRRTVATPMLPDGQRIEDVHIVGRLFCDQPDFPNDSRRVRLRFINADTTIRTDQPYIYCNGLQQLDAAVVDACSRGLRDGRLQVRKSRLTPTIHATAHLRGVTRGTTMRSQPWWGKHVAVFSFAPNNHENPALLPEYFEIGAGLVQAIALLEHPDDPEDGNLCMLWPLSVSDGIASFQDRPAHYRSTIC
ncbi:MAG: hypothetical protein WC497_04755 [Patescibacteria group bacterium]